MYPLKQSRSVFNFINVSIYCSLVLITCSHYMLSSSYLISMLILYCYGFENVDSVVFSNPRLDLTLPVKGEVRGLDFHLSIRVLVLAKGILSSVLA